MRLKDVINALEVITFTGDPETDITSVEYDSRACGPGSLFAAVRGLVSDGRDFAPQAVAAGASAVLTEAPLDKDPGVAVVQTADVRSGMALAAAALYGRPAESMTMVGITGTNGKTTTTYILESIINQNGWSAGVLGTVNIRFAGETRPTSLTTPEGPDLQRFLGQMRDHGVTHAVMEAASHALDLSRLDGCGFDVGIFTNLTQDHLDYHGDMETYFQAKRLLFSKYLTGRRLPGGPWAVINADDEHGRRLAEEFKERTWTYGVQEPADVTASRVRSDRAGISGRLATPKGEAPFSTRLLGDVNLSNILAASASALRLGITPEAVSRGLEAIEGVPGRLQRVGTQDDFLVLVDYAHTPDAVARVLSAARGLKPRRLLALFGCGGDRDRTKRPLMAKAAGREADLAILTSDNPRTEDPLAIIEQVEAGLKELGLQRAGRVEDLGPGTYLVEPDRRSAISLACKLMEPGDVAVIAGKGHEDYQILGREKIHFDDREEASAALKGEGKF